MEVVGLGGCGYVSLDEMLEKRGFLTILFFNDTATTEIYTLSLHDALPISVNLGLRETITEKIIQKEAEELLFNRARLNAMSSKTQSLADGQGLKRIAEIVEIGRAHV